MSKNLKFTSTQNNELIVQLESLDNDSVTILTNRDILWEGLTKGIYDTCIHDDTNSYEIYFIPPERLSITSPTTLKGEWKVFDIKDYNKTWSLYKEALE